MSTKFPPFPSAAAAPRLRLMQLMSASLRVLLLSASLILLTDCLEVGAVVLIVTELDAEVAICVAEVPPCSLHGGAASRDIS